jgi:hypothetical protein
MKDLSKLSDEDLLKLAQQEEQKAPSVDLKQLSDDELLQLAAEEESMLSKVGKTAGKLAGGVGMGIAEAVNPLAIPHGIETLVRAPFETTPEGTPFYKKPIVALEQASKNSFTAPNRWPRSLQHSHRRRSETHRYLRSRALWPRKSLR